MGIYKLVKFIPFLIVIGAVFFIFRPMLRSELPIPLDGLAGTYYPWLNQKWGYSVGVPVKNISVTDVFSQLLPWRILSLESIRHLKVPLWNPYSFSGTPLLANWQSAPFYPFNSLMLIFGDLWGWSLMVLLQPLLAIFFTYLYLKKIGLKSIPSLAGGFIFAFAGFMTTYLEYNTSGQILLWLPLLLYLCEMIITKFKPIYLTFISIIIFVVACGGFFQPALFVYLTFGLYFLVRSFSLPSHLRFKLLMFAGIFVLLGLGLSMLQLLPTFTFVKDSIRELDHNIYEYEFGLLPLPNVLSFLSPDFFGNPATGNFWGFMQYQETCGYFGIVTISLILSGIFSKGRNTIRNFFIIVFVGSLVLAFKNPLSQLVYIYKFPGISTGYASRWLILTSFSAAILAALGLDNADPKKLLRYGFFTLIWVSLIVIYSYMVKYPLGFPKSAVESDMAEIFRRMQISFRNTAIPLIFASLFVAVVFVFKKTKYLSLIILLLLVADLTRFSYKFLPFAPIRLSSSDMPSIKFLQKNIGNYRFEKESGPLMPSNTWINFRLMSPDGYDPLISKQYATWFRVYNSDANQTKAQSALNTTSFTRYLEWTKYSSPMIDLSGVKYILAFKRDKAGIIHPEGSQYYYNFPDKKFKKVFDDGVVTVFENPNVLNRVLLFDHFDVQPTYLAAQEAINSGYDFRHSLILDSTPSVTSLSKNKDDSADIINYQPERVQIKTKTKADTILMLTDTYADGWKVTIDGQAAHLYMADGIYRAVQLPAGEHLVEFTYLPNSFVLGFKIFLGSLFLLAILTLIMSRFRLVE